MSTQTVSKTSAPPSGEQVNVEAPRPRKTLTNWRVLEEGKFIPIRIRCEGYLGTHPADMHCHSNIRITVKDLLRHMEGEGGDHMGNFKVKFRITDGDPPAIWRELEEAGIELQGKGFYCPHCREVVDLVPRRLIYHLQNHPGANRVNLEPQTLCMTLGFGKPDIDENNDLYAKD